ncbi:CdaR family protein [Sharpea azabuensis]|uniref:CdaR family protein n=1 Tax=Sharpea azabuensis TaxID=322505 RepID=UPI00156A3022|nr:CdaR family protein [Sharpea azabuensis]
MNNKNDRINHNDSSTDFFLKYIKKEKQEKEKAEEQKEEFNDRKIKTIQFFGNIYNSINKVLDHILLSKRSVIILSIVLTIVLYVTSTGGQVISQTTSGTTIKNVAVNVEGLKEGYEVSGIPDSVTIGLIGPSLDIYTTQLTKNYSVYADLTDYGEGTHTVNLRTRGFDNDLTVMILPETSTIKISPKVTKTFDLGYKFKNQESFDEKYAVSVTSLSKSSVQISASQDTLNRIDHVYAIIDIADKDKSFSQRCAIKAYDANGKEVNCTIAPSSVIAKCRVDTYSKVVPIQPTFSGTLAAGYTLKSYRLSPTTVTIYGKRSDIGDINTITCSVDITGLAGSTTLSGLSLNKDEKITKMSKDTVDIDMTIEKGE